MKSIILAGKLIGAISILVGGHLKDTTMLVWGFVLVIIIFLYERIERKYPDDKKQLLPEDHLIDDK